MGLKENIIIGKLIPAGTGMDRYRAFETVAPEYEPMQFWTSEDDTEGDDLASWLATQGNDAYDGDGDGVSGAVDGGGEVQAEPALAEVVELPREDSA